MVSERLDAYERDSAHKKDYDFVVINDNLEDCFREVEKIVISKKGKNLSTKTFFIILSHFIKIFRF